MEIAWPQFFGADRQTAGYHINFLVLLMGMRRIDRVGLDIEQDRLATQLGRASCRERVFRTV